jgi:hypothetical protein
MVLETLVAAAFAVYHTKSKDRSDKPILDETYDLKSESSTTNQPQIDEKLVVETPSKAQSHKSIQKQKQESVTVNGHVQINNFYLIEK